MTGPAKRYRASLTRLLTIGLLMLLAVDAGLLGLPKPWDIVLAAGSAVIGTFLLLHQLGEATEYLVEKKRHFWPRLPRLVRFVVLLVLMVIFPGSVWLVRFQTTRGQRDDRPADGATVTAQVPKQSEAETTLPSPSKPTNPARRPSSPAAVLSAEPDSSYTGNGREFFMIVRNTGTVPLSRVWATITASGEDLGSLPQIFPGYWEKAQGPTADLAPGEWDRLRLGAVAQVDTSWVVYSITYYKNGVRDSTAVRWMLDADGAPVSHGIHLELRVDLESFPRTKPAKLTRTFSVSYPGWYVGPVEPAGARR